MLLNRHPLSVKSVQHGCNMAANSSYSSPSAFDILFSKNLPNILEILLAGLGVPQFML